MSIMKASQDIEQIPRDEPDWEGDARARLRELEEFLKARRLPAGEWFSEEEVLQALRQAPQSASLFISQPAVPFTSSTPTSLKDTSNAARLDNRSTTAECEPLRPGFTRDGKRIVATRKVGAWGRQFIVETGAETGAEYEIWTGAEVGLTASEAYLSLEDMVELGKNDAQYTRDKRSKYIRLIGACYKPVDTATRGISRLPATTAIVQFEDERTPAKISRTAFRRVLGRKDADIELRSYFLRRGMVPPEDMPPKNIREPRQPTWAGAQSGQPSSLSQSSLQQSTPQSSIPQKSGTQQPVSVSVSQDQQSMRQNVQTLPAVDPPHRIYWRDYASS
ncbi:MAG: hypothetical protein M1812_005848 [Candelaria pacifica]|nr:MAG: hypothetical protein M1812_005848 [Candelaria pacifica]